MANPKVSIVKFNNKRENIKEVVRLCNGFQGLSRSSKVLIKPNLVMWDKVFPFPKYGVITTAVVVEEIVKLLKDYGCQDITIAEATAESDEIGSSTEIAFNEMGFPLLKKKYGVKLLDINRGPFTRVDFQDFTLDIASEVLETDFIINVPVLKTHSTTRVSLGFKNLKGCLALNSKMFCHHKEIPLDNFIHKIGEKISPALTIIDGIYSLERGPIVNGTAYRSDILIASRDMFAADSIGTMILGMKVEQVEHLRKHARQHGLPLDGSNVELVGEPLSSITTPLKWEWNWLKDNTGPTAFSKMGITGICFPKHDSTLCTTCSLVYNMLLLSLIGAFDGKPFNNVEFLSGKISLSKGGFNKTFLLGKCAIKANKNNPNIKEAIHFKGCPVNIHDVIKILNEHDIKANFEAYKQLRISIAERYYNKPQFVEEHFMISG